MVVALGRPQADEPPTIPGLQALKAVADPAAEPPAQTTPTQASLWAQPAPRRPQPRPMGESLPIRPTEPIQPNQTRLVVGQHAQALGARIQADALDHRNVSLTTKVAQDRDALELLQHGQADVALVATPLSVRNRHAGLQGELLGIELFVVITPEASPMRNLTRAQLRAVLTGAVTDWSHFGLPAQPIDLALPTEQSLTERAQRALIAGDRFASSARQMPNDREVCAFVADNPGALGVVRLALAEDHHGIRALGIDNSRPTLNAYLHGGYPFGSPVLLVTRGPARGAATELLQELRRGSIPLRPGVSRTR